MRCPSFLDDTNYLETFYSAQFWRICILAWFLHLKVLSPFTFEQCCWRRLLRVPWTARRCNQSILKEISPGCSLEGLMLKLKLQYFGHLMWRVDSLENTLMLGGVGGRRRREQKRMRWLRHHRLDGHEFEWTPGVGDGQGGLACCDSWGRKESNTTEWLNWLTDCYNNYAS